VIGRPPLPGAEPDPGTLRSELAAARLRLTGCQELVNELESRLGIPETAMPGVPPPGAPARCGLSSDAAGLELSLTMLRDRLERIVTAI